MSVSRRGDLSLPILARETGVVLFFPTGEALVVAGYLVNTKDKLTNHVEFKLNTCRLSARVKGYQFHFVTSHVYNVSHGPESNRLVHCVETSIGVDSYVINFQGVEPLRGLVVVHLPLE